MRLFFLLPRVPYPTEKGDKLRAFHQIVRLSKKHDIIICALNEGVLHEDAAPVLKNYVKELHILSLSKFSIAANLCKALFSDKPLQVGYYYNKGIEKTIHSLIHSCKPDAIFCQLIRVAEYVKDIPIPKILDYQDVFSKGVERRLSTSPRLIRPFLRLEYNRLLKYEKESFERFDKKIIISEPDKEQIPHPERNRIVVVANGVDMDFYHPLDRPKRFDLVFTGNMGYPPNIISAEFLVNKILPLVKHHYPGLRLLISGATPHIRVKALQSPSCEVSGWVPDIRESYASAKVFIAPMQIGTGLQNKLLEAMAMRIPCITSPLANQALNARPDEEIFIASTPEEYCNRILTLLKEESLSRKMAAMGYEFVKRNYNWDTETGKIEELLCQMTGK
jgi:sugar transferase (PEP-CTERM/EpsH1 system associated)